MTWDNNFFLGSEELFHHGYELEFVNLLEKSMFDEEDDFIMSDDTPSEVETEVCLPFLRDKLAEQDTVTTTSEVPSGGYRDFFPEERCHRCLVERVPEACQTYGCPVCGDL